MKKIVTFFVTGKSLFYLLFIGVFSYLFSFTINTIISQYLAPDVYGDFSIAYRSVFVISLLLLAGTNTSSVKYLSGYLNVKDYNGVNRFISWNLKLIIRTFAVSVIVFVLFYLILLILHIISIKNFTSYHYSVYAFWLAPFSAFYILLASYILSLKKNNTSMFFHKMATYLGLAIFLFVAIYFFEISVNYFIILLLLFITFCLIIIAELIFIKRILAKENIKVVLKTDNNRSNNGDSKKWMIDSINYTSVQVVFNLIFIIDLLIIEWIHPSEHSTGYYAAMLVVGNILWEAPRAITLFLAPRVTPLLRNKDYKELQGLINKVSLITIPTLLLLLLLIIMYSNYLLSLFGTMYSSVQIPLIVLCFGYFFGASSLTNARILMFLDSRKILSINISELIILIITGFILTYYFGLLGMSFSVLISSLIKAVLMFFNVKKRLPIKPYGFI